MRDYEGGGERRSRRRARSDEERRGFGGSRFLLEAHLEKATAMHEEQKGGKNARKPSGRGGEGEGGRGKRERTGPMSGPVASDSSPRFPSASFRAATLSYEGSSLDPFSNSIRVFPLSFISNHAIYLINCRARK